MSTPMMIFIIIVGTIMSALGWHMKEKLRQSRIKKYEEVHNGEETMTVRFGGNRSVSKKVDPNGTRKVYILVFLILIAFFGFKFMVDCNKLINISEKCSDITQGTVISVDYKHRFRAADSMHIVYRYKVENIIYEIDTTYNGSAYGFMQGGTYPVHYDPDEPKVSYIGETTPQQPNLQFYIILMAVFGLLTLGLMLTWKKVPPEDRSDVDE